MAADVSKKRLQVERLMEVVGKKIHVEDGSVGRFIFFLQNGLDNLAEHVLSHDALGLFPLTGEFGVNFGSRIGLLLLVENVGAQSANHRYSQSRHQSAQLRQDNVAPDVPVLEGVLS